MVTRSRQLDVGALLGRLARIVAEREAPILTAHDVTMWEYVVLTAVPEGSPLSQAELSARTRRDPTRLIQHLDALQARGLVDRTVDPRDRRRHRVSLTERGRELLGACRADVRAMEEQLLSVLPSDRARALVADLETVLDSSGPSADEEG